MIEKTKNRRLKVEEVGDATVVSFTDKKILDEQNIQVIGDQLFSLVDQQGGKNLVLNFGNVEFMSSAALGKLILFRKRALDAGCKLVLCGIDPKIFEVFKITKLDKQFTVRRDVEEALQAF